MISSVIRTDLLADLPPGERDLVFRHSHCVTLAQDEILARAGARIDHVYFPIDSCILLLADVDHRDALGVGLVGSEGLLGASLLLGVHTAPLQARVLGAGSALRVEAAEFQRVRSEAPTLERLTKPSQHILVQQLAQLSACAAFHVMDVRLACWLLMTHDRTQADRFYLTHDRLARMLGVQRSGVTTAAGALQSRKLITYARGHIAIRDREGLERAACSCYQAMVSGSRRIHRHSGHQDKQDIAGGISQLTPPDAPQPRQTDSGRSIDPGFTSHRYRKLEHLT